MQIMWHPLENYRAAGEFELYCWLSQSSEVQDEESSSRKGDRRRSCLVSAPADPRLISTGAKMRSKKEVLSDWPEPEQPGELTEALYAESTFKPERLLVQL